MISPRAKPNPVGQSSLSLNRVRGMVRALAAAPAGGDTAEIGIKHGGTSAFIAMRNGGRRHWACDTFTGLVDCGVRDGRKLSNGMFAAPREDAEREFSSLDNVRIVEGTFPESAPEEMKSASFAVVHLDVDTYESTKASFEFFETRMLPGGRIVMDDVLEPGTKGAIALFAELMDAGRVVVLERNPPQAVIVLP